MKTATFPSLRVDPALRQAAEDVLTEGESLSSFVEQSIRDSIQRRQAQREFIERGMESRERARRTDTYVPAEDIVKRLQKKLTDAKAKTRTRA
jgi:predicted transcriptional regulator